MDIPLTPSQAAARIGVATITIYKWIENGKIASQSVQAGTKKRIYLSQEAVELKRIEIAQDHEKRRELLPKSTDEVAEWVRQYQGLLGSLPPLYVALRQGKVTLQQVKEEARRRFDALA